MQDLHLPLDGVLFLLQQGKGGVCGMLIQILPDPFHAEAQFPQIPDHIQPPDIVDAVQPVAAGCPLGGDDPDLLVIPQGIHADVVELGNFTDFEISPILKYFSILSKPPLDSGIIPEFILVVQPIIKKEI